MTPNGRKYCKDQIKKKEIIHFLKLRAGGEIIDKVKSNTYTPEVSLKYWVRYVCFLEGIQLHRVRTCLDELGITGADLDRNVGNIDEETFAGVYLAIKLAGDADMYVLDDFVKGMSRKFEDQFKRVMKKARKSVYISSEMYGYEKRNVSDTELKLYSIDLTENNVSLR